MTKTFMKNAELVITGYAELLDSLKDKIRSSQLKASISVNTELIRLYWEVGREILQKQKEEGWGTKVIERLAKDLKTTFPQMAGFSPRNLFYMKQFAEAYPDFAILQQAVAKIPWGHNMVLIDKLDELTSGSGMHKRLLRTDGVAMHWKCGSHRNSIVGRGRRLQILQPLSLIQIQISQTPN